MTSQKIDRLEIRKDEGQRRNCNAANNESRENRSWINVAKFVPRRSSFDIGRSDDREGEKLALRSLANAGKNTLTRSFPKILATNANNFRSRSLSYVPVDNESLEFEGTSIERMIDSNFTLISFLNVEGPSACWDKRLTTVTIVARKFENREQGRSNETR